MKRYLALSMVLCLLWAGCKAAHPSKVTVDPAFDPNTVKGILIAPFVSSVIEGEDPERQSERIMNRTLVELLNQRGDYRFISSDQFMGAVNRAGLGGQYASFREQWAQNHAIDKEFVQKLKLSLNAEVLLLPLVYLWHKDEADYREAATNSVTQIGAVIALVEMGTGAILWEGSDENFREAVRSEDRDVVSSGGIDRRVGGVSGTGRDMYAAPPFEEVAQIVLESIVGALPPRTAGK